jgi:hypothetical protein
MSSGWSGRSSSIALKCNVSVLEGVSPVLLNEICCRRAYCLVIFGRNANAVVLHFDGIEAIVLEAHISMAVSSAISATKLCSDVPIDVAPASRLFSTSSFTTEQRSTMT